MSGRPGRLLVFSRRPGNRLWEIDLREGAVTGGIESGDGYHFYGHGVASRDGRYLFTTENRYRDAAGVIRVRDTNDYRVIDEMPSGGIGPHELALLSDGRTLAVANGGIRTHPAQPRRKLNLDTMDPNLSYLDSGSGELLEQQRLHHHQLSIRHLAVTSDDRVVAVQQFEGRRRQPLPLVLQHRQGRAVETPLVDARELARMNHYTASTAVDAAGDTALVTSPKGNLVTLWDLRHNRLLASHDLLRPYGAAFDGARGRFVMTCEGGEVYTLEAGGAPVRQSMPGQLHGRGSWDGPDEYKWDNHLLWLPINNGERRDVA